jgi:hypothetical protein
VEAKKVYRNYNSFIVNLTHSFLYEKASFDISQIQLYIYKLYEEYIDDIVINQTNTWIEIEYLTI